MESNQATKVSFSSDVFGQKGWQLTFFENKFKDGSIKMAIGFNPSAHNMWTKKYKSTGIFELKSTDPEFENYFLKLNKSRDDQSRFLTLGEQANSDEIAYWQEEGNKIVVAEGKYKGWVLAGRRAYDEEIRGEFSTYASIHKQLKDEDSNWTFGEIEMSKTISSKTKVLRMEHSQYGQLGWTLGVNANDKRGQKEEGKIYKVYLISEGEPQNWRLDYKTSNQFNIVLNDPECVLDGWKLTVTSEERDSGSYFVGVMQDDAEGQLWESDDMSKFRVSDGPRASWVLSAHRYYTDKDVYTAKKTYVMVHSSGNNEGCLWKAEDAEKKKGEDEKKLETKVSIEISQKKERKKSIEFIKKK